MAVHTTFPKLSPSIFLLIHDAPMLCLCKLQSLGALSTLPATTILDSSVNAIYLPNEKSR
jgi:hypothetical protein